MMHVLAHNPQQVFGVLIGLERGMDPVSMAARLGGGVTALLEVVDAARAGQLPRQRYWKGDRMQSELAQPWVGHAKGKELFLVDWHRAAIALIVRPQGALTSEVAQVARNYGKVCKGSKLLTRLRESLLRAGFPVEVDTYVGGTVDSLYIFAEADRLRMLDVISNGWVAL